MSEASHAVTQAVLAADDRRHRFLIARDAAGLSAMVTDDLVYTHSTGKTDTKSAYLAPIEAGTTIYRSFDRSDAVVHDGGSGVAWMTGRLLMTLSRADADRTLALRFLSVWVEQGGSWRMAACQTTLITPR